MKKFLTALLQNTNKSLETLAGGSRMLKLEDVQTHLTALDGAVKALLDQLERMILLTRAPVCIRIPGGCWYIQSRSCMGNAWETHLPPFTNLETARHEMSILSRADPDRDYRVHQRIEGTKLYDASRKRDT